MWVLPNLHMDANNWNAWKYEILHLGKWALLLIMVAISSLKYLWVSETGAQLLALFRPCLHIEMYLGALGQPK